ncbi:MAG: hypothetical protein II200_08330 [Bacteroidaceae bacterium]|nr:hypothetical protein [Bacteroidaceae bacterium]
MKHFSKPDLPHSTSYLNHPQRDTTKKSVAACIAKQQPFFHTSRPPRSNTLQP